MANKIRGVLPLEVDGVKYTLQLDINAMIELEESTGEKFDVFAERMQTGAASFADLRRLVHATLMRHHPDATLADAGDILSEYPDAHIKLMLLSLPQDQRAEIEAQLDAEGEEGNGKPTAAKKKKPVRRA